ncbi:lipin Ned1 [Exophiala xenobiotica]|uniref:Lipin Ned1 n=1 Tax=Lithohypha guttulata TaxID=1690604 RepID=A0ABR0JZP4_9EURO|nr:lipin Ned1 [Lithohypha guttulata]KAK5312992.1 lipin Ned1 [Exophiala xenobiotica]
MQYVRGVASAVAKTYNSINPATLSGAIDVIVIEQEDGSLACSPFHVRFGKFQLLRPSEKKVEFRVNGQKQDYAMKLGEGGEAFFVFETQHDIPASMQTSPLVSPASSPDTIRPQQNRPTLQNEPSFLDLEGGRPSTPDLEKGARPILRHERSNLSDRGTYGTSFPQADVPPEPWSNGDLNLSSQHPQLMRAASEELISTLDQASIDKINASIRRNSFLLPDPTPGDDSATPTPTDTPTIAAGDQTRPAYSRALTLSKKLSTSNIRSKVTESGDLMLDMTGYKSSEDQALRAEALARKLLSEELESNYDIGSLIGTDEKGNLWIYSSEEAKDAANKRVQQSNLGSSSFVSSSESDPGYHSDSDRSTSPTFATSSHVRAKSEEMPNVRPLSESTHFAKTLRLTSDQLKKLDLKPGHNPISFTVNKSTCSAMMYLWKHETPIVISDIDGTITKSDVWGHVYNTLGKDWTHIGVAKLYSDIVANGYNIFYLTSRSVGQADTTRNYLNSIEQDGWKLPKGPVIMSPDRTIAALRREVYLRKPEVFKMACLRDILSLFPGRTSPFYAGFGNRLTDALSYRTVHIPSSRIFTINSKAEVSLDLLSLNTYKSSYVNMRQVVDQSFPPTSTLVKEGGEDYTDFKYWREDPSLDIDHFVPSDSEDDDEDEGDNRSREYLSRASTMQRPESLLADSVLRESIEVENQADFNKLRIVDSLQSRSPDSIHDDDSGSEGEDYVNDYIDSGRRARTVRR